MWREGKIKGGPELEENILLFLYWLLSWSTKRDHEKWWLGATLHPSDAGIAAALETFILLQSEKRWAWCHWGIFAVLVHFLNYRLSSVFFFIFFSLLSWWIGPCANIWQLFFSLHSSSVVLKKPMVLQAYWEPTVVETKRQNSATQPGTGKNSSCHAHEMNAFFIYAFGNARNPRWSEEGTLLSHIRSNPILIKESKTD